MRLGCKIVCWSVSVAISYIYIVKLRTVLLVQQSAFNITSEGIHVTNDSPSSSTSPRSIVKHHQVNIISLDGRSDVQRALCVFVEQQASEQSVGQQLGVAVAQLDGP